MEFLYAYVGDNVRFDRRLFWLCFHWANLLAEHSLYVFVYRPTLILLVKPDSKALTQKIQIAKAHRFKSREGRSALNDHSCIDSPYIHTNTEKIILNFLGRLGVVSQDELFRGKYRTPTYR